MNVIVTGGTSFIGLAVIRKLLKSGHEVWAAVRPGSANKDKLPSHERLHTLSCSLEEIGDLPFTPEGKQLATMKDKAFLHMAWDGVGSAGRSDKNIQEQNIRNSIKAVWQVKPQINPFFILSPQPASEHIFSAQSDGTIVQYFPSSIKNSSLKWNSIPVAGVKVISPK